MDEAREKIELVAIVESPEAVTAAVQNGADAVCVSLPRRGPGRSSPGPGFGELADIARYCLVRGCALRAAVYSVAPEDELPELIRDAREAAALGVSAFSVRDPGLLLALRETLPELPVCADERWGIRSVADALGARALGALRLAPARELSLRQLRLIADAVPDAVEFPVCGAGCTACSGLCALGEESSAGGQLLDRCSYACHKNYSLGGRSDDHPLRPRPLCLLQHIGELRKAGLRAALVDARRAAPEFAAAAVSAAVSAVRGETSGLGEAIRRLERAFAPEGFTTGFLHGGARQDMLAPPAGPDPDAARFRSLLRRQTAGSELRRVPVELFAVVRRGEPSRFAASDDEGHRVHLFGPVPDESRGSPLTEEALREELYRSGGTPYRCRSIHAAVDAGLSLPEGSVAELRRGLLDELSLLRAEPLRPPVERPLAPSPVFPAPGQRPELVFQVSREDQLCLSLAFLGPDRICLPLELVPTARKRLEPFLEKGSVPVAVLPPAFTDGEESEKIAELLAQAAGTGIREVLVSSLGQLRSVREAGLRPRGDLALHAANARTLALLGGAGVLSAAVSPALRPEQIRQLSAPFVLETVLYGRVPLMSSEHCFLRYSAGRCVCPVGGMLDDGAGRVLPVMRDFGCRNTIYSADKLFLIDSAAELMASGIGAFRLCFTTESPSECAKVAAAFLQDSGYRPNGIITWNDPINTQPGRSV